MRFTVIFVAALLASTAVHAERATERYAPAQIFVARDLLGRARAAASVQEFASAATYAKQAEVDARIAWGMTDAAPLRAEAAAIAREASAIAIGAASIASADALTTRNADPAAGSYRPASGRQQVAAPTPR